MQYLYHLCLGQRSPKYTMQLNIYESVHEQHSATKH